MSIDYRNFLQGNRSTYQLNDKTAIAPCLNQTHFAKFRYFKNEKKKNNGNEMNANCENIFQLVFCEWFKLKTWAQL